MSSAGAIIGALCGVVSVVMEPSLIGRQNEEGARRLLSPVMVTIVAGRAVAVAEPGKAALAIAIVIPDDAPHKDVVLGLRNSGVAKVRLLAALTHRVAGLKDAGLSIVGVERELVPLPSPGLHTHDHRDVAGGEFPDIPNIDLTYGVRPADPLRDPHRRDGDVGAELLFRRVTGVSDRLLSGPPKIEREPSQGDGRARQDGRENRYPAFIGHSKKAFFGGFGIALVGWLAGLTMLSTDGRGRRNTAGWILAALSAVLGIGWVVLNVVVGTA